MTEITAAITGQVDIIAKIYENAYRASYAAVAEIGRRKAASMSWMRGDIQMSDRVTRNVHCMPGTEYLCEETLAKVSRRDADALVARYAAKVEGKAEGMTNVQVSQMDASGSFTVTGTKAGHDVEICQSVVTKVSPKGTWFCQFPALIYVDGKKSTESALKAL